MNQETDPMTATPGPGKAPFWGGRLLLLMLGVLIVLNLLWMVRNGQKLHPPGKGQQAPDFQVAQLAGGTFRLSEARGHPVLVDFWATWCEPCKQSLPILDRVYAAYKDRGLRAIAIETEGAAGPAKAFAASLSLKLPIGLETGAVSQLYNVDAIPHLVLIDPQGQIRRVFRGVHEYEELAQAVESAGLPGH